MRIVRILLLVALVAVVLLVIAAPIGPVPGVFIGGAPTEAPAQWPDTSSVDEIRLRVPGVLPRVVIIWVIEYGGDLNVVGASDSGWVRMIGTGSPVDMRLGDETYALEAVPITEDWEPVLNAYVEKYRADYPEIIAGFPEIEEARGQVAVFRLERG
ncbi:MAG: hypothetical protein RIC56_10615 [Pseudomonadales bacterium]